MDQRQADDHTSRLMAHDLLQSVAIIQSILGVVRAGNRSADRLAVDLSAIETEVQVMARRLHATLDAAERAEQFDVRRVAQRVIERIGTAYTGQIDLVSGVHAIEVFGDWLEWERALLNLMENACRAAGPDGKVIVKCDRDGDFGRIEVGDTGPGFGEGQAGRSSLGLLAVTRLLDRHSGHLELRRSSLGGALLAIVVPLGPQSQKPRRVN